MTAYNSLRHLNSQQGNNMIKSAAPLDDEQARLAARTKPRIYDIKLDTGVHEVGVSTADLRGYFEHHIHGEDHGGGLWFEPNVLGAPDGAETPDGKLILTDYDGVAVLPMKIIKALRGAGIIVSEDFE